jgi:hypothetical protein
MTQDARRKITDRSAWIGSDLLAKGDWIYPLTETHIAEIEAAPPFDGRFGQFPNCFRPNPVM